MEKGSLVLVTGANGFIASHTINELLENGYRVRGTLRSLEKAQWLVELFGKRFGDKAFEPVVVSDMVKEGAFDEVMEGCSGVVHMASDLYGTIICILLTAANCADLSILIQTKSSRASLLELRTY